MKNSKKLLFTAAVLFQTFALFAQTATEEGGDAANPLTGDTWLIAAWGKIVEIAKKCWEWFEEHVRTMLLEDMGLGEADQGTLIVMAVVIIILTVMLSSGAWAASIAQMRRHNAPKFFFYGFFSFFIGPMHLLYSLPIKGEAEQKAAFAAAAAQKRAEEKERARLEEQQAIANGKEAAAVSEEGIVWDKKYFASIQRNEDGTPAGPWAVQFNNIPVTVLEIVEVLDENVQVKMLNLEGTKTIGRIPYSRLQKWEETDATPFQEIIDADHAAEAAKAAQEAQAMSTAQPAAEAEVVDEAPALAWNEEYFNSIKTKDDGTPNGPWQVTYNGITIQVVQIVEVLKECVQVKMINLEGTPTNGRIPYKRIESWVDAE